MKAIRVCQGFDCKLTCWLGSHEVGECAHSKSSHSTIEDIIWDLENT